ncbi:hypothetical protein [Massilia sp. TS11]|uniref:hypothetical protein n=1 Tax=Massilia sp. TS11 TaxID=2908003 RepID=UPI001EDC042A|nr:hypothetical protein [Massilia sp. TS11]MCG2586541.1 hypothetical protein [Massilia sp. TS11]
MIDLQKKPVKIVGVNPRAEIHGEERKPAYDLTLEFDSSNDVLIPFHPELRHFLFQKPANPDLADQAQPSDIPTERRFPRPVGNIKWDFAAEGYSIRVAYGIGGPSDIKLSDVKIHKVKFLPKEGGTVTVGLTAIVHPETEDVGRLCEFIQQQIEMDITPPAPTSVHDLFPGGEKKAA